MGLFGNPTFFFVFHETIALRFKHTQSATKKTSATYGSTGEIWTRSTAVPPPTTSTTTTTQHTHGRVSSLGIPTTVFIVRNDWILILILIQTTQNTHYCSNEEEHDAYILLSGSLDRHSRTNHHHQHHHSSSSSRQHHAREHTRDVLYTNGYLSAPTMHHQG